MHMITSTTTGVRTYEIDEAHSEAVFQVRHLLTKVSGRFEDFSGAIQFDEAAPANSSIDFTIQAGSINTNQPDRDAHLRSADFFDVERFPALTFVSRVVRSRGDGRFDVTGDLTIHGVTRAVTLPVTYLGIARDPWGNERAGFETEIVLNRRDFGLTWNAALETGGFLVGDDVRVTVSVQAIGR
jgi:polyisoprenoid-binding protein YceI